MMGRGVALVPWEGSFGLTLHTQNAAMTIYAHNAAMGLTLRRLRLSYDYSLRARLIYIYI